MARELFDDIDWDIEEFPSVTSSGDDDDWIQEHNARGIDENGNEVTGTAYYTLDKWGGFNFDYIEYEPIDDEEEEDEEW